MAIRLGLCCIFLEEQIKFRTTTVTHLSKMDRQLALNKLSELCLSNANALMSSLIYCKENNIGHFRINSRILPCYTHEEVGYEVHDLPEFEAIICKFKECGEFAKNHNIRTAFHPDQFVVLNSQKSGVVDKSIEEIEYQAMVAKWVNCDVVNIHAGGAFGNKQQALGVFKNNFYKLSYDARNLLTLENDDTTYTPEDLLPLCQELAIPLVYDVHHHRCNKDGLSIEAATKAAFGTWNREPLFHLSSPINGWGQKNENQHHDYINPYDFPDCWRNLNLTVEVEAKAKELAVKKLLVDLHESIVV